MKNKEDYIFVKVVYGISYHRKPSISHYPNKRQADAFIRICEKWGIDIVSCDIIPHTEVPEDFIL